MYFMIDISVIIPVFNAEQYLNKCLDSIINQTVKNIEIICVDDRSTDGSVEVLEYYSKQDKRLKILLHDQNKGTSAARNSGLATAKGQYIYFMDNDDWIELNYLEKMLQAAKEHNSKIVVNVNTIAHAPDRIFRIFSYAYSTASPGFLPAKENISKLVWPVWMHLYESSFLKKIGISFPEGCLSEDVYFQYMSYVFVDKVFVVNDIVYHYNYRCDNASSKINYDFHASNLVAVNKIYDFYVKNKLFDRYNIRMFFKAIIPNKFISDYEPHLVKVREYFEKIKDHVFKRAYIYDEIELFLFDTILNKPERWEDVSCRVNLFRIFKPIDP
jgi:glycosyltransferase involved in cell wall biosynthesis